MNKNATSNASAATKPSLAVIDDDSGTRKLVARIARGCGFDVHEIDGTSFDVSEVAAHHPDVLVVDLVMPKMDGIQLLRHLADSGTRAEIIIMSGMEDRILDSALRFGQARELSIVGSLRKPFTVAALESALRPLIRSGHDITGEDIANAIAMDQFVLFYQPKVHLQTMRVVGTEALVRWRHPIRGMISPVEFVPIAERENLMGPMTQWVLKAALGDTRQWIQNKIKLTQSVNVSAANLDDLNFPDSLSELCLAHDVPPSLLTLEVTESAAMADVARSLDILTRMRLKGVNLSIDDFGTGFSSLVQLHRMPFSEMKVDKTFVLDAHQSKEARTIIKSIIDLGHNLGVTVVAEGVERKETVAMLVQMGCDIAQGFYFARPMPVDDLPTWIASTGVSSEPERTNG